MNRRCFFIGHADTTEDIFPGLSTVIERQIEHNGVTEFYVGNHGRFDAIVYRTLKAAKRRYPHIRCFLVLAYHPGAVHVDPPAGMDGVYYPLTKSVPPRYALYSANRAMVKQCGILIAAVNHPSRSRDVLEYARRREKQGLIQVINLLDK